MIFECGLQYFPAFAKAAFDLNPISLQNERERESETYRVTDIQTEREALK